MKSRIQYIDIAKGIGILLVVFGHSRLVLDTKGELFNVIFSFHMPLFFFLSGIFFNPTITFPNLLARRAKSLLRPYFVTLFLVGIGYYVLSGPFSLGQFLYGILYGVGATIAWGPFVTWGPLWFLPHLFLIFVVAWLLLRLLGLTSESGIGRKYSLLAALLVIGVVVIGRFWQITIQFNNQPLILWGLPLGLDIVLITTAYFLLGYFSRQHLAKQLAQPKWLLLSAALFIGLHAYFNLTIDFNIRQYDHLVISTVQALAGIHLVLATSQLIAQYGGWLSNGLRQLGERSLIIFILHGYIQYESFLWLNQRSPDRYVFNGIIAFLLGVFVPVLFDLIRGLQRKK
ncbi:MAG: acyltransferase family protein [Candidatus Promineifilaceae bacterium]